jgi:NADH:ubiquinone oxidoreductase subunit K
MFTATPTTLGRRACAALAFISAGLHAAMLGHAPNVVAAGLLAAMIVACVYCARDLWLRGSLRAWCVVGLMNIAMIAIHLPMPAHHHGLHQGPMGQQPTLMGLATAIAAVEVVVAMAVLYYRTRRRAQLISGTPAR